MKKNFHKVFKEDNNGMADIFFRYMSNCRTDMNKARVNYLTFLQKFECMWPKKPINFSKMDESEREMFIYQS